MCTRHHLELISMFSVLMKRIHWKAAESGAAVRAEARRVMSVAVNTWRDPPASVTDE